MPLTVESIPRPQWTPLPYAGCENVAVKVLLTLPHISLALLKFDPYGTIHEHDAEIDIEVICLEGEGMVSVGREQAPLRAGERVSWPAKTRHRLWTHDSTMLTLMVEQNPSKR